jgi:NAD(P)-dependent dehydrogenase (short-subunit alcohol dehydrogenase family)
VRVATLPSINGGKYMRKTATDCGERFKTINILINNASTQAMCDDLAEIDLDQVENTFQSNIIQMFAITKFSLPHMNKGDSYVLTHPRHSLPSISYTRLWVNVSPAKWLTDMFLA